MTEPDNTTCPICDTDAEALPVTGDFEGFNCPAHGKFEVSGTVMSLRKGTADVPMWEKALQRAKARAANGRSSKTTTSFELKLFCAECPQFITGGQRALLISADCIGRGRRNAVRRC
jgi:hypothetical protein